MMSSDLPLRQQSRNLLRKLKIHRANYEALNCSQNNATQRNRNNKAGVNVGRSLFDDITDEMGGVGVGPYNDVVPMNGYPQRPLRLNNDNDSKIDRDSSDLCLRDDKGMIQCPLDNTVPLSSYYSERDSEMEKDMNSTNDIITMSKPERAVGCDLRSDARFLNISKPLVLKKLSEEPHHSEKIIESPSTRFDTTSLYNKGEDLTSYGSDIHSYKGRNVDAVGSVIISKTAPEMTESLPMTPEVDRLRISTPNTVRRRKLIDKNIHLEGMDYTMDDDFYRSDRHKLNHSYSNEDTGDAVKAILDSSTEYLLRKTRETERKLEELMNFSYRNKLSSPSNTKSTYLSEKQDDFESDDFGYSKLDSDRSSSGVENFKKGLDTLEVEKYQYDGVNGDKLYRSDGVQSEKQCRTDGVQSENKYIANGEKKAEAELQRLLLTKSHAAERSEIGWFPRRVGCVDMKVDDQLCGKAHGGVIEGGEGHRKVDVCDESIEKYNNYKGKESGISRENEHEELLNEPSDEEYGHAARGDVGDEFYSEDRRTDYNLLINGPTGKKRKDVLNKKTFSRIKTLDKKTPVSKEVDVKKQVCEKRIKFEDCAVTNGKRGSKGGEKFTDSESSGKLVRSLEVTGDRKQANCLLSTKDGNIRKHMGSIKGGTEDRREVIINNDRRRSAVEETEAVVTEIRRRQAERSLDRDAKMAPNSDIQPAVKTRPNEKTAVSSTVGAVNTDMMGYDWIAGLLDNERDMMDVSEVLFEELRAFRSVNKRECVNATFKETDMAVEHQKEAAVSEILKDKKVVPYRVNDRLFTEPILTDEEVTEGNSEIPTHDQPRFVRVSIARSTIEPPHSIKPHRRRSFDATDAVSLRDHCMLGWQNSRPAALPTAASVSLKDAVSGYKTKMTTTLDEAEKVARSFYRKVPDFDEYVSAPECRVAFDSILSLKNTELLEACQQRGRRGNGGVTSLDASADSCQRRNANNNSSAEKFQNIQSEKSQNFQSEKSQNFQSEKSQNFRSERSQNSFPADLSTINKSLNATQRTVNSQAALDVATDTTRFDDACSDVNAARARHDLLDRSKSSGDQSRSITDGLVTSTYNIIYELQRLRRERETNGQL